MTDITTSITTDITADITTVQKFGKTIKENIAQVIVGKEEVIDLLLVALCCEGHLLLEDVPGIGKTTLAKTLAKSLGCSFQRIQFTPDLLPSDITGVSIFNQQKNEFEYRPGPILAQVVLTDEINRAGPRTQSALLEAMEERQVTVDGETRPLPYPFLVLATQNPVELEGTFPLPEAQMDRFLMRVAMGYPKREEERQILHRFRVETPINQIAPVVTAAEIQQANQLCRQVYIHPVLEDYLLDLIAATRTHEFISLGVSPRGTMAFYRACQALAGLRGRAYVLPDDIKTLAIPVLSHRMSINVESRLNDRSAEDVVKQLLATIPVPVEEIWTESGASS